MATARTPKATPQELTELVRTYRKQCLFFLNACEGIRQTGEHARKAALYEQAIAQFREYCDELSSQTRMVSY